MVKFRVLYQRLTSIVASLVKKKAKFFLTAPCLRLALHAFVTFFVLFPPGFTATTSSELHRLAVIPFVNFWHFQCGG